MKPFLVITAILVAIIVPVILFTNGGPEKPIPVTGKITEKKYTVIVTWFRDERDGKVTRQKRYDAAIFVTSFEYARLTTGEQFTGFPEWVTSKWN